MTHENLRNEFEYYAVNIWTWGSSQLERLPLGNYSDKETAAAWDAWQAAHASYAGSGWHTGPDSWPRIGEKYIVKIRGHLQEDVYEFDQGDDGIGGGEYFWSRDDVDDCPAFDPNKDEWLLLSDADTNPPAQENSQ